MNCKKAQQWISLAIDNELSPDQTKQLEQHLAQCPECQSMNAQWRSYGAILRAPADATINTEVLRTDVLREIRTTPSPRKFRIITEYFHTRPGYALAMLLLISMVIIAGLQIFSYTSGREQIAERNTEVEWVETDVPGATAMVYEDEETGLTVIWVITDENGEEENGQAAS